MAEALCYDDENLTKKGTPFVLATNFFSFLTHYETLFFFLYFANDSLFVNIFFLYPVFPLIRFVPFTSEIPPERMSHFLLYMSRSPPQNSCVNERGDKND